MRLKILHIMEHLTVTMGDRTWMWTEVIFLKDVLPPGRKGGARDEAEFVRHIELAALAQRGLPLAQTEVMLQPVNEHDLNPQMDEEPKAAVVPPNGTWVTVWIQWRPEVARRELMRSKHRQPLPGGGSGSAADRNRHYLLTASMHVDVDANLLTKAKWGTTAQEPPVDEDKYAYRAMPRR